MYAKLVMGSDFVDHRFWALVGVPAPTLPAAPNSLPFGAAQQQQQQQQNASTIIQEAMGVLPNKPPTLGSSAEPAFDEYSDLHMAYDLVLSDGRSQVKALLSPLLSMLAEKGGLLPTGVIRVREAAMRFDETVVADKGFILLRALDVIEPEVGQLLLVSAVHARWRIALLISTA